MNLRFACCAAVAAALGFATTVFAAVNPPGRALSSALASPPELPPYVAPTGTPEWSRSPYAPWSWIPDGQRASKPPRPTLTPLGGATRQELRTITGEVYDGVIPLNRNWMFEKDNGFAWNVAISGNTLVAFSKRETVNPFSDPESGPENGPGVIHFFEKRNGEWQRTQKLDIPAEMNWATSKLGNSMVLNGDTLFLADSRANVAASRSGKVYVYTRIDDIWKQTQVLTDGVVQNHSLSFGSLMAVQGDRALISNIALNELRGAVYAYSKIGGVWTQTQKLELADAPQYAQFGLGLALDGSTAMMSTSMTVLSSTPSSNPAVYAYELDASSGEWHSTQSWRSCGLTTEGNVYYFGSRTNLAGDVAVITDVVGSTTTPDVNESSGIACVYTRSNGVWTNSQVLTADDGIAGDLFGASIAMNGDLLAIGSVQESDDPSVALGAIYVFSKNGAEWNLSDKIIKGGPGYLNDNSGGIGATAFDGTTLLSFDMNLRAGVDRGGLSFFDFPAQATTTPESLTLSLAPGEQTSVPVQIANVGKGAALSFSLTDGGTLSQMSEEAPIPSMGIGIPQCRLSEGGVPQCLEVIGTASASWYRRFYFGEYPHVGASATIDAVTVGIEGSQAGIPVSVKLYTKPHDDAAVDTLDSFQLEYIGGGTAVTDGTPRSLLRVPMDGTVTVQDTAFEDLVVEYHVDGHPGLPAFVPGANASPQTHSTFITNPYLGDYLYAGRTSHILISPHLDPAASGIRCATPENTPWLSVAAPTEGRVAAGASQDLAVTIDASDLAPGNYSTELCVATKGPLPSMMRVPVELTVSESGDAIFGDGFDSTQR